MIQDQVLLKKQSHQILNTLPYIKMNAPIVQPGQLTLIDSTDPKVVPEASLYQTIHDQTTALSTKTPGVPWSEIPRLQNA